jgi:hypothetical protein
MTDISVDLLVIGGGVAGLTAAAAASERGATVVVAERAEHVGGSGSLSNGVVWTAPDSAAFLAQDPQGDLYRFRLVLEGLPGLFAWLERAGTRVGEPVQGIYGFGSGRIIDIHDYIAWSRARVERSGGRVIVGAQVMSLVVRGGSVVGANVHTGGYRVTTLRVTAPMTVIATGGFQADTRARELWMFPGAGSLFVRSNSFSDGGGIRLGLEAGAGMSPPTAGFYGHTMAYPLSAVSPPDLYPLTQIYSEHGVIVNHHGRRFTDESLGDHISNQAMGRAAGPALLLMDERIRAKHAVTGVLRGQLPIDRLAVAAQHGAHVASAPTLNELAKLVAPWGYHTDSIIATVTAFNALPAGGVVDGIPRRSGHDPLMQPPFHAIEIQAAVTLTYRGLATDGQGRALSRDGKAIPGLWVVGADSGGMNDYGYSGGLATAMVLGRRTGTQSLSSGTDRKVGELASGFRLRPGGRRSPTREH